MTATPGGTEDYTLYQADPEGYADAVLGVTLTTDQAAILRDVRDHRYTLVQASHGVGKTFIAGVAANWWYDCWDAHIVYVSAPTWPQALGLTFKEIKRVRRAQNLPGRILDTGQVRDPDPNRDPAHFIRALNAESGEGFQGEHSAPILIILEEGVGVPGYIWEAMRGLMTVPECRVLVIGNPTDEATPFGAAASDPNWQTRSISALDHPNITAELDGQPPPFPRAVRLLWLWEMLRDECEVVEQLTEDCFAWFALDQVEQAAKAGIPADRTQTVIYRPSSVFQGRVLGQFPTQASNVVIPKAWLALCPVLQPVGVVEIGCDPARFGDDRTTLVGRWGPCVLMVQEERRYDTTAIAAACKDMADALSALTGVPAETIPIKIDTTGGLGAGPLDDLLGWGYNAISINSSASASDPTKYPNLRSELWFATREWARTKELDLSRVPADLRQRLVKELTLPKWRADAKARKVVEDKPTLKKRLGFSPDLADGCNLAFLPVVQADSYAVTGARTSPAGYR